MFHEEELLRGKYLTAFNRQILDEIEAARRRSAPEDDRDAKKVAVADSPAVINNVPTAPRILKVASGR